MASSALCQLKVDTSSSRPRAPVHTHAQRGSNQMAESTDPGSEYPRRIGPGFQTSGGSNYTPIPVPGYWNSRTIATSHTRGGVWAQDYYTCIPLAGPGPPRTRTTLVWFVHRYYTPCTRGGLVFISSTM